MRSGGDDEFGALLASTTSAGELAALEEALHAAGIRHETVREPRFGTSFWARPVGKAVFVALGFLVGTGLQMPVAWVWVAPDSLADARAAIRDLPVGDATNRETKGMS